MAFFGGKKSPFSIKKVYISKAVINDNIDNGWNQESAPGYIF